MIYTIEPKVNHEEMGNFSNQELLRYANDVLGTDKMKLTKDIINMSFCYNYALNDETLEACDAGFELLEEEYERVVLSEVKRWDVVSFHKVNTLDDDGNRIIEEADMWNCKHFAKVLKSNGTIEGTTIRSKWGRCGIFDTPLEMVDQCYGDAVIFWRKKNKLAN